MPKITREIILEQIALLQRQLTELDRAEAEETELVEVPPEDTLPHGWGEFNYWKLYEEMLLRGERAFYIPVPWTNMDVDFRSDGWSEQVDEFGCRYFLPIKEIRDKLMEKGRAGRLAAKTHPHLHFRWAVIDDELSPEQYNLIQLNHMAGHRGDFPGHPHNPVNPMLGADGFAEKYFFAAIEEIKFLGFVKERKPIEDSKVAGARQIWAPNRKGLGRAKERFEQWWTKKGGFLEAYQYGNTKTKQMDTTFAKLQTDHQRESFLARYPEYEPR